MSDPGVTASIAFPTDTHRAVVRQVLAALDADDNVRGVLLAGSLARGTARTDSDVDVLVVVAAQHDSYAWCHDRYELPTDMGVRTVEGWTATFAPDRLGDESWGYAFLDGVVLRDPAGWVADLRHRAASVHRSYVVPALILRHYGWLWGHILPKMRAVLDRGDDVETGWAAAVMMNDLVRTVWAVNGLTNPSLDLGTVQRHLGDLAVPEGVADRVREILREPSVPGRLQRQIALAEAVQPFIVERLGERSTRA